MRLRLDLDKETHDRLLEAALREKRPIHWQAEVIMRRALGLPFPSEATGEMETQEYEPVEAPLNDPR